MEKNKIIIISILLLIILGILVFIYQMRNKRTKNVNTEKVKMEKIIKIDEKKIDKRKNDNFEKELNLIINKIKKDINKTDESEFFINNINHSITINDEKTLFFSIDKNLNKIQSHFRIKNKNDIEQYCSVYKDHEIKEFSEIVEELESLLKSVDVNIQDLILNEKNLYNNFEIIFKEQLPIQKNLIISKNEKYNYNIYSYGGEVKINKNGKELSLKEALLKNEITLEDILNKCQKEAYEKKMRFDMYKDGGTLEYKNDYYTVIKFNKNKGNDIYFTQKNLGLNEIEKD